MSERAVAHAGGVTVAEVPTRRRETPWWPFGLLTLAAAYAVVRLRSAALVECDVGINAGAAGFGVIGGGLLMIVVCLAGTYLIVLFVRSRPLAVALSLALIAACAWILLAATGAPDGYPSPVATCVDNVPTWWPGWLPA